MSTSISKEIRTLVERYGDVPPPWHVFPDTHPYSMFWRMGAGETYVMIFGQWWDQQNFDEERRIAYFRQWPPPPRWLEWMIEAVWDIQQNETEEGIDDIIYFERLERLGFGSKEAYENDLNDPRWLEQ